MLICPAKLPPQFLLWQFLNFQVFKKDLAFLVSNPVGQQSGKGGHPTARGSFQDNDLTGFNAARESFE